MFSTYTYTLNVLTTCILYFKDQCYTVWMTTIEKILVNRLCNVCNEENFSKALEENGISSIAIRTLTIRISSC